MSDELEVCLILDPNFGEKLKAISPDKITWICDSLQNRPVVESIWEKLRTTSDSRRDQLTLFGLSNAREEAVVDVISDIDLHHAWKKLRVYGVSLSPISVAKLESEFQVTKVINEGDGYSLFRE